VAYRNLKIGLGESVLSANIRQFSPAWLSNVCSGKYLRKRSVGSEREAKAPEFGDVRSDGHIP
jgi:hypothetical protein